ncbi:hypothetical protein HDV00_003574 [Rhizophlyctis rosea]|nr:hypothetical protein HDV00_003574 [Rhizophlyctis rosea]
MKFLVALVCLVQLLVLAAAQRPTNKAFIGYWYDDGSANGVPAKVLQQFKYYTHINYAFGIPAQDGSVKFEGPNLAKFATEAKKAGVKSLIAYGGWGGSAGFSKLVTSSTARKNFVNTVVSHVTKNGLDGIDIDWEYPGSAGETTNFDAANDVKNFLQLLKELRAALGTKKLISAAVAGSAWKVNGVPSTALSAHAKYLDYINLMNYDNKGSWDPKTGHDSSTQSNDAGVNAWVRAGFPRSKIVTGYPFYAKVASGIAKNSPTHGLNSAYKSYVNEGLLYKDLAAYVKAGNFKRYYDVKADSAYWWSQCKGEFITAPDVRSAWVRARLTRSEGLKGVMIWDISQDDDNISLTKTIATGLSTNYFYQSAWIPAGSSKTCYA